MSFNAPITSLLLLTLLALTGCGGESPAEAPERLTLGLALQPSSSLSFIALERGLFRAHGLEVAVVNYPSGKRALRDGLFRGEVELATSSDVPITFAAFERDDFRVLATTFHADDVNRVVARRDHGIESPADLAGKRLATQRASAVHFFLHLFLLEQGLSEEQVALQFHKAEQLPGALAGGGIDAFSMREPFVSEARRMLGERAVVFAAPGIYEQTDLLVTSVELVHRRPQVVERVLRALLEAEAFARREPERAARMVAARLGVAHERIAAVLPQYTLRVGLDQALLRLLEDQARWAIRGGLAEGEVPNYLELTYGRGLEAVAPERVTLIR